VTLHDLIRDRSKDRVELGDRQKLKIGLGVADSTALGPASKPHRVLAAPPIRDRVLEYRVRERQDVAGRFGRTACFEHLTNQALDLCGSD
jgi:hypothetical protein